MLTTHVGGSLLKSFISATLIILRFGNKAGGNYEQNVRIMNIVSILSAQTH